MIKGLKKKINQEYLTSEIKKIKKGDLNIVLDNKKRISEKISKEGVLKKYTELAKVMIAMVNDYRKGIYKKVPWFSIAAIVFSLLYVLNPLDMVPDFLPGIGYIDDLTVFTLSLKFLQTDLHDYLNWKTEKEEQDS